MRTSRGCRIALSIFFCASLAGGIAAAEPREGSWLGVSLDRGETEGGARVARVFRDSPAEQAGLRAQDRITALDGVPIAAGTELARRIADSRPGRSITLSVSRGDDDLLLDAWLVSRPEKIDPRGVLEGWIGLSAIDLPPSLRVHFGATEEAGVMIAEVERGSPAEAAGFEPGDVAYEMDEDPLGSVDELIARVRGSGVGNPAIFAVVRNGSDLVLEALVAAAPSEPGDPRR